MRGCESECCWRVIRQLDDHCLVRYRTLSALRASPNAMNVRMMSVPASTRVSINRTYRLPLFLYRTLNRVDSSGKGIVVSP